MERWSLEEWDVGEVEGCGCQLHAIMVVLKGENVLPWGQNDQSFEVSVGNGPVLGWE